MVKLPVLLLHTKLIVRLQVGCSMYVLYVINVTVALPARENIQQLNITPLS